MIFLFSYSNKYPIQRVNKMSGKFVEANFRSHLKKLKWHIRSKNSLYRDDVDKTYLRVYSCRCYDTWCPNGGGSTCSSFCSKHEPGQGFEDHEKESRYRAVYG